MTSTTDTNDTAPPPDAPSNGEEPSQERERPRIEAAVGKAARMLGSDGFGNGDRAELRRVSPEQPVTPALWKMLYSLGQQDPPGWFAPGGKDRPREEHRHAWERRWSTLLMGMAFCARPQEPDIRKQHLHDYGTSLGKALFTAGWSELRLVRLLRSTGEALEVEIRRVAQRLDAASQPADWSDVARLLINQPSDVLSKTRDFAEKRRLSVARSYYGARHAAQQDGEE